MERDQVFTDMHLSVLAGEQEACTVDEALAVLSLTERLRGDSSSCFGWRSPITLGGW